MNLANPYLDFLYIEILQLSKTHTCHKWLPSLLPHPNCHRNHFWKIKNKLGTSRVSVEIKSYEIKSDLRELTLWDIF